MKSLHREFVKSVTTTFAVIAALGGAIGWLIGDRLARRR